MLKELEAKCAAVADLERHIARQSAPSLAPPLARMHRYLNSLAGEELRLVRASLEKETARTQSESLLREEAEARARALEGLTGPFLGFKAKDLTHFPQMPSIRPRTR